jgi:MYXO-CTERM domain-containing protein
LEVDEMKRLLAILVLMLIPGVALAGGGGPIRLAKPIEKATVGEVTVQYQLMQHGQTPRGEGTSLVFATGPDGKTARVQGILDKTGPGDNVWFAKVPMTQPGTWKVKVTATHPDLYFEELHVSVEVASAPKSSTSIPYVGGAVGATGLLALAGFFFWRRYAAQS